MNCLTFLSFLFFVAFEVFLFFLACKYMEFFARVQIFFKKNALFEKRVFFGRFGGMRRAFQ